MVQTCVVFLERIFEHHFRAVLTALMCTHCQLCDVCRRCKRRRRRKRRRKRRTARTMQRRRRGGGCGWRQGSGSQATVHSFWARGKPRQSHKKRHSIQSSSVQLVAVNVKTEVLCWITDGQNSIGLASSKLLHYILFSLKRTTAWAFFQFVQTTFV